MYFLWYSRGAIGVFSIVTLIPLLTPPGVKSCWHRWVVSHLTSSALTSFLFNSPS